MKHTAKRRRSKQEIKEAKQREAKEKTMLVNKMQEVADLKAQLNAMNDNIAKAANLHDQVQGLVNMGIVKQNPEGHLVEVDDMQEREQIQISTGSKKKQHVQIDPNERRQA